MTKTAPADRVVMDLAPVWDAKMDLLRLADIIGAVISLIHREDDNGEREEMITALVALQEKLADMGEALAGAIKGMGERLT